MAASSPVTISQGFLSRLFTGSANRTANDPANTAFHGFAPSVLTVACEATFAAHYRRRWRRSSTMYEVVMVTKARTLRPADPQAHRRGPLSWPADRAGTQRRD